VKNALRVLGLAALLCSAGAALAFVSPGSSSSSCHGHHHTCTTSTSTTTTTSTTTSSGGPCGTKVGQQPATYSHVVWILFENHSYGQVIGSSSAPYINSIAHECGLATDYFAISHPSLPNYIALTSGSTQGITDDNPPSSHPLAAASIFSQAGSGWRSLEESMPSNCALANSGEYAVRHNPAAYYTGIRTACATLDVPLSSTPDVSAKFTFLTPNLCNDMHDCSVATGDSWLSTFLPKILDSPTYTAGGTAVFITWDEDNGSSGNQVPLLVISPYTPAGATTGASLSHYSLLRTTEDMLGVGCLANACSAADFRAAFGM
jgi:phosphatidylinositol-3-phosphatase